MTEVEQLENQINDIIQQYELKEKENIATSKELINMMSDVIYCEGKLLDLYKNQNKILNSHNKIFFNSIKEEMGLFENTPLSEDGTHKIIVKQNSLIKLKEMLIKNGYEF